MLRALGRRLMGLAAVSAGAVAVTAGAPTVDHSVAVKLLPSYASADVVAGGGYRMNAAAASSLQLGLDAGPLAALLPAPFTTDYRSADMPGASQTAVTGTNDSGDLVGAYQSADGVHAFVRRAVLTGVVGEFTSFDVPGAVMTIPYGINRQADVVGEAIFPVPGENWDVGHGFLRRANGTFTLIDVPGAGRTVACGINDSGTIVGYSTNGYVHSFVRTSTGRYTSFDPSGATTSAATGINDGGDVVGSYAIGSTGHGYIMDSHGHASIVDLAGGAGLTEPFGVSNDGRIAGYELVGGRRYRGFVRDAHGTFSFVDDPAGVSTQAYGVNTSGQVSGTYRDSANLSHGFVFTPNRWVVN